MIGLISEQSGLSDRNKGAIVIAMNIPTNIPNKGPATILMNTNIEVIKPMKSKTDISDPLVKGFGFRLAVASLHYIMEYFCELVSEKWMKRS